MTVSKPQENHSNICSKLLSEFKKLKSPPPEQEQIDLICTHALERYRVALYGKQITSVIDLFMWPQAAAALGPDCRNEPVVQKANMHEKLTVSNAPHPASHLGTVRTATWYRLNLFRPPKIRAIKFQMSHETLMWGWEAATYMDRGENNQAQFGRR